jgi:hypothetical protein
LGNNRSEVGVTVGAFDDIDAQHEVQLRLENILNLLAVWTNCSLEEQQTDPNADALDKSLADFWNQGPGARHQEDCFLVPWSLVHPCS